MEYVSRFPLRVLVLLLCGVLAGCGGVTGTTSPTPPPTPKTAQLTVQVSGNGTISSSPAGISCPGKCVAAFDVGTAVTLSASPASGNQFSGYSGACTGNSCQVVLSSNQSVSATFTSAKPARNLQDSINHIIFMLQENRSFDHFLGHLPDYWQAHTDQFPQATNGTTFDAEPADASNVADDGSTVTAFHLTTVCVENPSPSWNESHVDWNLHNPYSDTYLGDGFVHTTGLQKNVSGPLAGQPYYDSLGKRAMGYYTDRELNYYYFMASAFGTSDRWFSPVMSRTQPNRMYLIAGTSHGYVYPLDPTSSPLSDKTIFQLLDENGISWKIYTTDSSPSYLDMFKYYGAPGVKDKIVPAKPNYFNDLANGTLPQVVMIEGGYLSGLDDHPTGDDTQPGSNIQAGSAYVSSLISALMQSSSWKDSVFILTYDEGGGFYDHVAPIPMPSPDDIPPSDLRTGDVCTTKTGPTCDFVYTGYRVPLIVVSPFTKNHVSHTPADYTAILKLIETRFNLPSLTARDAHQMDMTEFFDFDNAPWLNPPTPPAQLKSSPCYVTSLP
jgi:phospholipase C